MAIGAVVVEVQTEEELAIPVNETAKNTAEPLLLLRKGQQKKSGH